MNNLKKYFLTLVLAGFLHLGMAQFAVGQTVQNGNFTSFSTSPPSTYGGQLGYNTTLNNWTNGTQGNASGAGNSYNFIFTGGNAGDQVIVGSAGNIQMAGPVTGNANGLALPTGYTGNVVAADPVYETGPIYQTITGLTTGQKYSLTFMYAGAEQYNYNAATTEYWTVALGAGGLSDASIVSTGTNTTTLSTPADGFSGWHTATLTLTATAATDTLYFLAGGGPTGDPPFVLLAGVGNLVAVPEPIATSAWILFFAMLILLGKRAWRSHKKRALKNA